MAKEKGKKTKTSKSVGSEGIAHILATFNNTIINITDKKGNTRHWILEIHFVDRDRQIGGFFEQLLIPVC